MLTFYSVVKGFEGEQVHIQHNAVHSWTHVYPTAEVIWFGNAEPGAVEAAARLGVPILPMRYNEHGAPLIGDVISIANQVAKHDVRCLVNADIILDPNFRRAVQVVAEEFDEFLFIAERRNVQIDTEIHFEMGWPNWIRGLPNKHKANRSAVDFFCYRGDWLRDMPDFGMGRTAWDNWIVNRAFKSDIPIIDGTKFTTAWHQEHYKDIHPDERDENRAMLGPKWSPENGSLDSAGWRLGKSGRMVKRGAQ